MADLSKFGFTVQPIKGPQNVQPITPAMQVEKPKSVAYNFNSIPSLLRNRAQWICWDYVWKDGKWDKVPVDPKTGLPASSTEPRTWGTFEQAVAGAPHKAGIGFVLQRLDNIVIIDLDDKPGKPASDERVALFREIYKNFDTYTELSVSGTGMHVICMATDMPQDRGGHQFPNLDVFWDKHFFTFTGNTDLSTLRFIGEGLEGKVQPDVKWCQAETEYLLAMLSANRASVAMFDDATVDVPETKSLDELVEICSSNENSDKFFALWGGDISGHADDQNRADNALIEFFRFAGATMAQSVELFRMSKLYRPPPAKHRTYPMRTARTAFRKAHSESLDAEVMRTKSAVLHSKAAAAVANSKQATPAGPQATAAPVPVVLPPGALGELAKLFYSQAYLQHTEISIVAAFGFMTAVCGLNWQTPTGAGLNLYQVIVAPSGIGKEAASTLPGNFYRHATAKLNGSAPSRYLPPFTSGVSSAPALMKLLSRVRCVLHIRNEMGGVFKSWSNSKDGVAEQLRSTQLRLYSKSSHNSSVGDILYSDNMKNVADPGPCAYSFIGDVTDAELYPSITAASSTDGGLSRMSFVPVPGYQPRANPNAGHPAPDGMLEWAAALISQREQLLGEPPDHSKPDGVWPPMQYVQARFADEAAYNLAQEFAERCRGAFNHTEEGFVRQLHTRANLKVLKYATLMAVADNYLQPSVTTVHLQWAMDYVMGLSAQFNVKVETGEVGMGDSARVQRIIELVKKYLTSNEKPRNDMVTTKHWDAKLMPISYFTSQTGTNQAFTDYPLGHNRAVRDALSFCVESGWLYELEKQEIKALGFSAKSTLYRVIDLPGTN